MYVENQSHIHRLDEEARHVGEDEDKEDRSQHEQESLGEKIIKSRMKYLKYLFRPSLVLIPDADSFAILLHLLHLESVTVEQQSTRRFKDFTLKYMAMSVAMMVMVGMVNTTMYIIVFGLYPCKVQVKIGVQYNTHYTSLSARIVQLCVCL